MSPSIISICRGKEIPANQLKTSIQNQLRKSVNTEQVLKQPQKRPQTDDIRKSFQQMPGSKPGAEHAPNGKTVISNAKKPDASQDEAESKKKAPNNIYKPIQQKENYDQLFFNQKSAKGPVEPSKQGANHKSSKGHNSQSSSQLHQHFSQKQKSSRQLLGYGAYQDQFSEQPSGKDEDISCNNKRLKTLDEESLSREQSIKNQISKMSSSHSGNKQGFFSHSPNTPQPGLSKNLLSGLNPVKSKNLEINQNKLNNYFDTMKIPRSSDHPKFNSINHQQKQSQASVGMELEYVQQSQEDQIENEVSRSLQNFRQKIKKKSEEPELEQNEANQNLPTQSNELQVEPPSQTNSDTASHTQKIIYAAHNATKTDTNLQNIRPHGLLSESLSSNQDRQPEPVRNIK